MRTIESLEQELAIAYKNIQHQQEWRDNLSYALNRTKRALWLARAERARLLVMLDLDGHYDYIISQEEKGKTPRTNPDKWYIGWKKAEHKCRQYADKFKEET